MAKRRVVTGLVGNRAVWIAVYSAATMRDDCMYGAEGTIACCFSFSLCNLSLTCRLLLVVSCELRVASRMIFSGLWLSAAGQATRVSSD